jgi:hypothetical protein
MHYMTYVVVEVGVANSDPITGMCDVKEAVIINLRGSQVSRQVGMINPDICGCVQADSVASFIQDTFNLQVSKNHIVGSVDVQGDTLDHCIVVLAEISACIKLIEAMGESLTAAGFAEDSLVRSNANLIGRR